VAINETKDAPVSQNEKPQFYGIIPPLVTPLRSPRELDVEGLERLLEHVITGGVHGVFMLGSTGEALSLSHRAQRDVVDNACRIARGRVPVLVGITDTSFEESVELARHAAAAGAQALVITAPYYYLIGHAESASYLEHLVAELPLPVLLYNIPKLTKIPLEVETVRRMMNIDRIVGIKDSSGDMSYVRELLALAKGRKDWSVLVGDESLMVDTVRAGGHGGVTGGANYSPRLYADLYDAAARGDETRQAVLSKELSKLAQIHGMGTYVSGGITGIKFALSLMGICGDCVAEPLSSLSEPDKERIRAALANTELLKT
jgi:2-dehydro-3-deoxy-D-pentonate aldolase